MRPGRRDQPAELEALLSGLNDPQRAAVTYGSGPQLILAGAGSGKTRVLTHRIAYLVGTDAAKPNEILAITFTNKAASEMRDRAELLVGRRVRAMWVMTFHSACARMLRAEAQRLGYTRQFTIYDTADSRRLIKRCLDSSSGSIPSASPRRRSAARSPTPRTSCVTPRPTARWSDRSSSRPSPMSTASTSGELHRANAMDFDDLLVRAVNVLELFPEVRERYANGLSPCDGRRVPGHQPRPVPLAAAAGRRAPQPDGRRRRRPVPRRGHAGDDGRRIGDADRAGRRRRDGSLRVRRR